MEKKNTKLFMAAALIALLTVAGGSLYASPSLFNSPQKQATATQFWSDADLFLSPKSYTGVEFDKFFGAVSFQSDMFTASPTQMMQLGFATQFGGLYTALYYGGNTFGAFPDEIYQEKDGKRIYPGPGLPSLFKNAMNHPHNEVAVLIGIADIMGFRISYVHSYRSRKLTDFYADGDLYDSFTDEYGSINPEIAWGMAKPFLDNGIQPHVYVDLDFFRDNRKYDEGDGELIVKRKNGPNSPGTSSNNEFTLGFTAALGGFSLFEQNGFDFGIDLWYTLSLKTFNNEYTPDPDDPSIVAYKGKYHQVGNTPDSDNDYYRVGYNDHLVTPYLYASWSGGKLKLSAELGLGLGFTGEKGTQFDMTGNAPVKDGFDFSAFTFSFNPNLDLGLQWAIVPDKFYLNVGSGIKFFDLAVKTSTIDTYDAGDKDGDPVKEVDKTFGGAVTSLMLGFTFNPTVNLGVQAMSGIDINTNNVNVFKTDATGLAVFSQIMVTLKF